MTDLGPISSILKIEREEGMTYQQQSVFEGFILNRLSDIVPRDQWDAAVASALEAFKKLNREKEMTPCK